MYVRNYIRDCSISLTQACNLNCQYCFRNSGIYKNMDELDFVQWKSVFQKLKEGHVLRVLLTGGEPFMRTDLDQIIEELLHLQIQISIATNGTINNQKVIEVLGLHSNSIGYVQISLDGDCPVINDRTRGNGSFLKSIQTIKALKKKGVHVSCRITLSKFNVRHFRRIYDFIYNTLLIHDISINEIQQVGRGISAKDIFLSKEDRINLICSNWDIINKLNFMDCEIGRLIRLVQGNKIIAGGKLQTCMRAYKGIHILHNGDIVPCDMLADMKMSNILDISDLLNFWKENEVLNTLRKRTTIELNKFSKCIECEFENQCTGSCPVSDFQMSRSILSNEDFRCLKYLYIEYFDFISSIKLRKENYV